MLNEDQQNKIAIIEQYTKDHKTPKISNYLDNIKKQIASGDSSELDTIIKAAIKDVKKFDAAAKANKKKKDGELAEEEWNENAKELNEKIAKIHEYLTKHNSPKITNYMQDIDATIVGHNISTLPAANAIADAAIKDMKKYDAAAKSIAKKKIATIPDSKQNSEFTTDEIQNAEKSVQTTIDVWLKKYGYKDWESAPAEHKKAKIEQEINNLIQNKKYKTWEIAVNAYKDLLQGVEEDIAFINAKTKYNELRLYKAKSKEYSNLLNSAEKQINSKKYNLALLTLQKAEAIKSKENAGKNKYGIKPSTGENKTTQNDHTPFASTKGEQINTIMNQTGVDKKVANDYYNAVLGFSFQWDYEIRQIQCGNDVVSRKGHTIQEITKKAQDIEDFVSKSPKWNGGTLYRGIAVSDETKVKMYADLKAGTFSMLGGASWSSRQTIARGFACNNVNRINKNKIVFICDNQKNATSIRYLSHFPNEDEVYASMANRYKFKKEVVNSDYTYIYVDCK